MQSPTAKPTRIRNGGSHDCYPGLDLFARRLHLNFPSGRDKFDTCTGVFVSFCYVVTLMAVFGLYLVYEWQEVSSDEEKELGYPDWFRLGVRLVVDFVGLALFLYAIGWVLNRCCTRH